MRTGVIGPGRWKRRRAAAGEMQPTVRAPLGLGVKRAPNPVASRMCGTWKPRRGPGGAWQADCEGSWIPRREQDAQEANAGSRKATGNSGWRARSSAGILG